MPYVKSDSIAALVCGLPRLKREQALLVMLVAYFDDSGSNKEGPVMILAGWVTNFCNWMNFSDEWQALLEESPKLRYFKLREASRCEEQFGRFRPKERDARALQFFTLLKKYKPIGVVASVRWRDIQIIQKEYPNIPGLPYQVLPYQILFHGVMIGAVEILGQSTPERMLFVFDQQGRAGHLAEETYDRMRHTLPEWAQSRIIGTSQVDDKEVVPLQAADSLAWLMRRHADKNPNCPEDLGDWQPTESYLQPLRQIPRMHNYFPLDRLRKLMDDLQAAVVSSSNANAKAKAKTAR